MTRATFLRHGVPLATGALTLLASASTLALLHVSAGSCTAAGVILGLIAWAVAGAMVDEHWPAGGQVTAIIAYEDELAGDETLRALAAELDRRPPAKDRLVER